MYSNNQLRRSNRKRHLKRKTDLFTLEEIKEPLRNRLNYNNKHRGKIELNEQEKDLLYKQASPKQDRRYCHCERTEAEAAGSLMIACDKCDNWFHDECIGFTAEEIQNMESYICTSCSDHPIRPQAKKPKPSTADIELLINALAEIDEERPNKPKKKTWEPKFLVPKVAVFHLNEPESCGKYQNIIGYIRNDSHPNPSVENGNIVPITQKNLERRVVCTAWGNYRLTATPEGRLQISRDFTAKSPEREIPPPRKKIKVRQAIPLGQLEISTTKESVEIKFEDLKPIVLPSYNIQFEFEPEKCVRLAQMMGIENNWHNFSEFAKEKLKHRPSILIV
jgi:hypothetical protein